MSASPPTPAASLADRLARLTPEQRALLRERLGAPAGHAAATPDRLPRRAGGRDTAPLSSAQRRFWFLQSLDAGGHSYNSGAALRITGPLDEPRLLQALQTVVARHDALRTTIAADPDAADGVSQRVLPPTPPVVERIDLRRHAGPADDPDSALLERLQALRERPFEPSQALTRYALIRTADDQVVLFFCLHHIVADGWSFGVFMRDLQAAYGGEALAALPVQFGDYAAWEAERAASPTHRADIDWWLRRLANTSGTLDLPRPAQPGPGSAMHTLDLPANSSERLRAFAAAVPGATPFVVLLAVLKAVLARACRAHTPAPAPDVVVATALAHRDRPELQPLVGNFADVLLLRTPLADDPPFALLCERVRDTLLDAQAHAGVALAEVIDALESQAVRQGAPASIGPRRPPAEVLLSFLNVPHPQWESGGLRYAMVEIPGDEQDFGLYLSFHDNEGRLQGQMSWRRDRFDDATARAIALAFEQWLPQVLAQPRQALSALRAPALEPGPTAPARVPPVAAERADTCARALRALPGVLDLWVGWRDAGRACVAWLVLDGPAAGARVQALLQALPDAARPDACCVVARLPLTANGEVDRATLERLPMFDLAMLDHLERRAPDVAAMVVEASEPMPRLPMAAVAVASDPPPAAAQVVAGPAGDAPLALADGGPLHIPADAPAHLVDALLATVRQHPQQAIVYAGLRPDDPDRVQTYAQLHAQAGERLAALRASGLRAGDRAILCFNDLREHITSLWACLLGGVVPVTVAVAPSYRQANGVVGKLVNTWQHLGQPVVLSTTDLAPALRGLADWMPQARLSVLAVDTLPASLPPDRLLDPAGAEPHRPAPGDTAFIQLSSGSTGVPKCIAITHSGVLHHVHAAVAASGLGATDVSLNWLPLDHVVPMLTCHLTDTCLGRRQVMVPTDAVLAEPLVWLDRIERHRVTHSWAPNFAFRLVSARLAAEPQRRWDLSSMRWFVDAGEQTTAAVVTEFLERTQGFGLPPACVHNEFGMAELCTTMTFGGAFDPARTVHRFRKDSLRGRLVAAPDDLPDAEVVSFVPAGRPTPGVRLRIADAQGQTVAEGVIGRLQVQGAVVTPGYIDNAEANAAAFADAGWFDTGDLGFIAGGVLTLTGRAKETIIIRGANFYCYEIEDVVNQLPDVRPTFVACCAAEDRAAGTDGLAVFYVPAPGAASPSVVRERIAAALGSVLGLKPQVVVPLEPDEFPKTTSGKIQRAGLAVQLREGAFAQRLAAIEADAEHGGALPAWFSQPVWHAARHRAPAAAPGRTWVLLGADPHISADAEALWQQWPAPLTRIDLPLAGAADAALRERLDASVAAQGWPDCVIDLYALQRGSATRLLDHWQGLARWLARDDRPATLRLQVVTCGAEGGASAGDGVVVPDQAVVEPVITTMAQELALQTRCIDIADAPLAAQAGVLRAELLADAADRVEPLVALRNGQRWLRRLQPVRPQAVPAHAVLPQRVTCLITGGLGALGQSLARWLLTQHDARLLLVGRRPASDASVQQALHALDGPASSRVRYAACDVADAAALASVVAQAEAAWGAPLARVAHLAGHFHQAAWHQTPRDTFDALLAPKVAGTEAVLQLLQARPAAQAWLFSSAAAHLPSTGTALYAAANRALEACAQRWNTQHGARAQVLAWSAWPGLGMSRDGIDAATLQAATGFMGIAPAQGWSALQLASAQAAVSGPLVIGLDPTHPRVRRWLEQSPLARQALVLATEGRAAAGATTDRFGTPVALRVATVPALPRDAAGAVDRTRLAQLLAQPASQNQRALQGPVEPALATLWGALLGLPRIGAGDHFFALGGHSLLAVQLVARIRERFGVALTPRVVFESPTLAAQAAAIADAIADATAAPQTAAAAPADATEYEEGVL